MSRLAGRVAIVTGAGRGLGRAHARYLEGNLDFLGSDYEASVRAYDEALKYAKERRAFGKSISSFQAIQFKLVDMIVQIDHAKLMMLKAAWEKDQGRDFAYNASLAKLYAGEISHRVVNDAVQIHGGYGFIDEYPVSRMYRDQKINEIGEGTNEVQRMIIARMIGI